MTEELKCTKLIRVDDGSDPQGKPIFYHKRCGLPASEVTISGTLTQAKATLCARHKLQADKEAFTSQNGYPMGRIDKKAKEGGYAQTRLPGTGITS